jgi:alpha-tubulin suppressor-like RCC1 family protein
MSMKKLFAAVLLTIGAAACSASDAVPDVKELPQGVRCVGNGAGDTCHPSCPCAAGGGDCDSNAECQPGLVCANDLGSRFGMQGLLDVCVAAHCTNGVQDSANGETGVDYGGVCGACPANGLVDSCSPQCPCASGGGDCDSAAECQGGLACADDRGARFGMNPLLDVCLPAHCTNGLFDPGLGEVKRDCGGPCGKCETSCTNAIDDDGDGSTDCHDPECPSCPEECPAQCPASTPVCSNGACRGIKQVSAGGLHACAVIDDGTVRCWGNNRGRQLGDGTTVLQRTRPGAAVIGVTDVEQVAAGYEHSCAITRDGSVWCWGDNVNGQLGVAGDVGLPVRVALEGPAAEVECHGDPDFSSGFTCARMTSGKVYCWGANFNGQIGNGSLDTTPTPTPVTNLTDAVQIGFAAHSACAVRSTGSVVCWGFNGSSSLGTGSTELNLLVPEPVLGLTDARDVDGGLHYYCAITGGDDSVKCWGNNERGQIGPPVGGIVLPPFDTGVKAAKSVHAGWGSTCTLLQSGQVSCWGNNWLGQFGNGNNISSPTPTTPAALAAAAQSLGYRWATGCALLQSGQVQCWGENFYGILGNGTAGLNSATPTFVDWSQTN